MYERLQETYPDLFDPLWIIKLVEFCEGKLTACEASGHPSLNLRESPRKNTAANCPSPPPRPNLAWLRLFALFRLTPPPKFGLVELDIVCFEIIITVAKAVKFFAN